jgi:TonB-dependent starch-binding outer membrane protein SusC
MRVNQYYLFRWCYGIFFSTFILLFPIITLAQSKQVTGVVKDEQGGPLSDVSVVVKNGKAGTKTDASGRFSIAVPAKATLVFSFTGFGTQELPVQNQSAINLVLHPTASALNDVVVVGYGTMRKSDLTGAAAAIKGSELRKAPVTRTAEALTGKLPGVQVQTTEGQPGADILINIRGGTSISQDNSPLYVIDGFPSDRGLNQISPQDIERIDILKDASATAIYGARGANGVILITTRSGEEGKASVTYDGYVGVKKFGKELDVLSPYEYVVYQYERTRGIQSSEDLFLKTYGTWADLEKYKNDPGIDWQKEVFGNSALNQSHSIAITGGTKTTKYRISYSRDDEKGIMLNTSFKRDYFKLKLDQKVTDKLSFTANAQYAASITEGAGTSGTQDKGSLKNSVMYRPTFGLLRADSMLDVDFDPAISLTNPVTNAYSQLRRKNNSNIVINASIDYKITNDLTFRTMGGLIKDLDRNEAFDYSTSSYATTSGGPFGTILYNDATKLSNTNLLTFAKTINSKHEVNAMIGEESIYNKFQMLQGGANKFDNNDIGLNALQFGNVPQIPQSREETEKLLSFFGRAFYNFNKKYLITATLRADGSSKFIGENRWGYFPSIAVAWQANKEKFINDLNIFSDLKFRVSYGVSGNNRIGNNKYSSTFGARAYAADGTVLSVALTPNVIANPNLKWESTIARNIGMDFGFFKNRVTGSIDAYLNDTKNLLLNAQIPGSSGYTTQFKNIGSTQNKGLEVSLSTKNVRTARFNWNSDFNISFFRSKITGLNKEAGFEQQSFLAMSNYAIGISDYLVKVGEPVGVIYGFVNDGFYRVEDFDYDAATKKYTLKANVPALNRTTTQPGDMKFKDFGGQVDANGNPMIADDDRQVIGHTTPKFFGGFNNSISYGNFDLSVFMNFSVGNQILNANRIVYTTAFYDYQNVLGVMRDRWRTVNDQGQVVTDPKELSELNKNATIWKWQGGLPKQTYSWAVEDGSFLRINNISLGYTFANKLIQRAHLKNLRLYATAYNVYTITGYSGFDPEVNVLRSSPFTPGIDYSAYPKSKSYVVGVNVTF